MKFARPRFTMRWVMIAFTVLGVAFYVLFVRPTVLAEQFVRNIQRGDFAEAEAMLSDPARNRFGKSTRLAKRSTIASMYPRDWSDVWHFRRTIEVSSFALNGEVPSGTNDNSLGRFLQGASDNNPATGLPHPTAAMRGSAAYEAGPFGIRLIRNDIRQITRDDRY